MASVAIVPIVVEMFQCASLPSACYADHSFMFRLKILMSRRHHHHVYVVELSPDVMYESRFKKANPDYISGKPCVYVGMTGLDPDQRFDKHKAGIQSNKYVEKFGLRLLPDLYAVYNPMPYQAACEMEVELGIALREAGCGVWQA